MKTILSSCLSRLAPFAIALGFVLSFGGCATTGEVKAIVQQSNYEMLLAADPRLAATVPADPASNDQPPPDAAARVNAFLGANPDDKTMHAALRLRQALLYLNQGKFNLADSARSQVVADDLHSARDRTLASAFPHIRWWAEWAAAGELTFRAQKDDALRHLAALQAIAADKNIAPPADTRDYLLEMRAWLGLKLGLSLVAGEEREQKELVESAVNVWTAGFTDYDLGLVNATDFTDVAPLDLGTRRVLRVRSLLKRLANVIATGEENNVPRPDFQFQRPEIQRFYTSQLPGQTRSD